jgi:hypothetical protein
MVFLSKLLGTQAIPRSSHAWFQCMRNFSSQTITSPTSVATSQITHKDFSQERKMTALELQTLNRKGYFFVY